MFGLQQEKGEKGNDVHLTNNSYIFANDCITWSQEG